MFSLLHLEDNIDSLLFKSRSKNAPLRVFDNVLSVKLEILADKNVNKKGTATLYIIQVESLSDFPGIGLTQDRLCYLSCVISCTQAPVVVESFPVSNKL